MRTGYIRLITILFNGVKVFAAARSSYHVVWLSANGAAVPPLPNNEPSNDHPMTLSANDVEKQCDSNAKSLHRLVGKGSHGAFVRGNCAKRSRPHLSVPESHTKGNGNGAGATSSGTAYSFVQPNVSRLPDYFGTLFFFSSQDGIENEAEVYRRLRTSLSE